jgi:hypothetical protein
MLTARSSLKTHETKRRFVGNYNLISLLNMTAFNQLDEHESQLDWQILRDGSVALYWNVNCCLAPPGDQNNCLRFTTVCSAMIHSRTVILEARSENLDLENLDQVLDSSVLDLFDYWAS